MMTRSGLSFLARTGPCAELVNGDLGVDLSFWERAKRYRRLAASVADEELTRKINHVARLGDAGAKTEDAVDRIGKSQAAD